MLRDRRLCPACGYALEPGPYLMSVDPDADPVALLRRLTPLIAFLITLIVLNA